ncbi:MAG TPA: hypothetical protein VMW29_03755 [Candidatus Bathyarchaeia archaeon]|nr:hypothetical protein [Candidatus Bathyarchaeia archaeon]
MKKKEKKVSRFATAIWHRYDPLYFTFPNKFSAIWQILRYGKVYIQNIQANKKKTVIKKINYWVNKYRSAF